MIFGAGCGRGSENDPATRAEPAQPPAAIAQAPSQPASAKPVVHVYKTRGCGCCAAWVEHLEAAGYPVQVEDVDDIDAVNARLGIPARTTSCHTAQVDGYLVEGHVPAADIDRMLAERPPIAGLAVPGMPARAPGMAEPGQPIGGFDVVSFTKGGGVELYKKY
jgi:hypothetical protein